MSAEVKPGYKQTEVGIIPEEWDVRSVFDIADRKKNLFDDGDWVEAEYITQAGVRLVQTGNIGIGEFIDKDSKKYISEESFKVLGCKEIKPGDVLICRLAEPAGRACIFPETSDKKSITSVDVTIFRPKEGGVDRGYLNNYFSSRQWFSSVSVSVGGTTHKRISRSALGEIKVPFPGVDEQSAIAASLIYVDSMVISLEQLIAKKRDIKQAAMQQLLTGQKRLPGFSGEWSKLPFGEIARPRGARVDPRRQGAQEFCIELEHLESGTGRLLGSTTANENASLKTTFQVGDVLFGKLRAYLRKFWLADRPGVCSTEIWALEPVATLVTADYLKQIVMGDLFIEATSNAHGTHMPRSDWHVVKNLEILLPAIEEQNAIATILSDMDSELAAIEARRDKARQFKQGMMQELLTGRIRLK